MKFLKYRNGDQMPILGLGTWQAAAGEVYHAIREAIDIGYRHIDCAAVYGNEKEIGKALKDAIKEGSVERQDLWITSKLWGSNHGRANVLPALRQTLDDLQLDYIDLYLIHWPVPLKKGVFFPNSLNDFAFDTAPLSDTWAGMEDAVDKKLARHIGVSNFGPKHLERLMHKARITPENNQVEIHAYNQQPDLVSYCQSKGIHLTCYSPLGSMDRPDRLKKDGDPMLLQDKVIANISRTNKVSPAQVLLANLFKNNIAAIPKSVNPRRLKENFESVDVHLLPEQMEHIRQVNKGRRFFDGAYWVVPNGPLTYETLWE